MELKCDDFFFHINQWYWGHSIDIVKNDGSAIVCVKFDKSSFPKTGYICDLSVLEPKRKKGLGDKMRIICRCKDRKIKNKVKVGLLQIQTT